MAKGKIESSNSQRVNVIASNGVTLRSNHFWKIGNQIIGRLYIVNQEICSEKAWYTNVAHLESDFPNSSILFGAQTGSADAGLIRINSNGTIDIYGTIAFTSIFAMIMYEI